MSLPCWGSLARISGGCAPKAVSSVMCHLRENHPLPSLSPSQSRLRPSRQKSSAIPPSFVVGLQDSLGFHLSCPSEREVGRWWPSLPSAGDIQTPSSTFKIYRKSPREVQLQRDTLFMNNSTLPIPPLTSMFQERVSQKKHAGHL